MAIRIYNTLGGKKEAFEPITAGKVRMYVCGPTVYDSCHIGHARSVVVFDVIARYLRARDYEVTYVRNFTDVDDKIINRANSLGVPPLEIAEKYIEEFHEDMDALGVSRADMEPRVTECIDVIIDFVSMLVEKDKAYQAGGDVYFAVDSFEEYGKLSGRKLEDMMAGARVEVDAKKRNPCDFALWKEAKPGEPFWDSPWGKGRPGWHIECSAMSGKLLGETFDIHGGGKDLIFPHHENEIAQSEGAHGKPFARYWIHNGFVNIDQEKMSKSLGNFLMIKDVIASHHPESIRLFLLSNHYRSPIDYTPKALEEAGAGLDKMYGALKRIEESADSAPDAADPAPGACWTSFCEAMDDDFNTARGVAVIFEAVRDMNRRMDQEKLSDDVKNTLLSARADILRAGRILGILAGDPGAYFDEKKSSGLEEKSIDPAVVERMIEERAQARKAKDWAAADRIRDELDQMNIILEDRPDGTRWKVGGS